MSKDYVSIEQKQCPVCGVVFDSGAILMDTRLEASFERNTVTGYQMCEEHQKLYDDGYIAVIEAEHGTQDTIRIHEAERTGRILHMRRAAFCRMFSVDGTSPLVFMRPNMFQTLVGISEGFEDM